MTPPVDYPHWVQRVTIGGTHFYLPVAGYPDRLTNRPAQAWRFARRPGPGTLSIVVPIENVRTPIELTPVLRLQAELSPGV